MLPSVFNMQMIQYQCMFYLKYSLVYRLMKLSDISWIYSTHYPHIHFTTNSFISHSKMSQFPTRSETTQNSGHFFTMCLVLWMGHISTVICLWVNTNQHGTKRVEWHKTAWHVAALTSNFNMYWVGVTGAHLMQPCSTMLVNLIWLSLQGNSIWLMLDSECVMHYLSHTERSNTTLQNGAVQLWGMFMFLIMKRCWYTHRPSNAKELYNLWHASARNIIEWIFGILKRRFWILTIPPESSMAVQAHIPPALCTIHNFIWIHDPEKSMTLKFMTSTLT